VSLGTCFEPPPGYWISSVQPERWESVFKPDTTVKLDFTLVQAITDQTCSRNIAPLFNLGARRCGWSTPRPGRFTARERDPVPNVQKAGWALVTVWTGAKNLTPPPPGFDPLTVQAVAGRYTDYDILAPAHDSIPSKLLPTRGIFGLG
jgi:hypothetical protein